MCAQPKWPIRSVRLVLCTAADGLVGALPRYDVDDPGWRETEAVVNGCVSRYGFKPVVLRILSSPRHVPPFGGRVEYLAEVEIIPRVTMEAWEGSDPLVDEALRLPYARPGGPQKDLEWARRILDGTGIRLTAPPAQVRTWNLSSIWRLATDAGRVWLKSTPPFCAHEGAIMSCLSPEVVPQVLGFESGRVLLSDVAGVDQYEASDDALLEMIDKLVGLQIEWIHRTDELVSLGARDWRPGVFLPAVRRVYDLYADRLDAGERRAVDRLLANFESRFAQLAACGVVDTLVHGDFHSGNVRGMPGAFRLLDWGDCAVGHPLIDELAFFERRDGAQAAVLHAAWLDRWRRHASDSDPEQAAMLLRPLTPLKGAVVYQDFLDGIEPDERRYHEDDPLASLRSAAKTAAPF